MAKKASIAWLLFFVFSGGAAGTWGCSYLTGIPVRQRWDSFIEKTVVPLWRWDGKEPPPEEDLKDVVTVPF